MRNKVITAITAAALALTLTGCGEDEKSSAPVNLNSSSNDKTSSESTNSTKPDKPQTVESRKYKRRPLDELDNEDVYVVVEILDNGGWYISSDTWAGQTYASYSFEEEAAGAYVTVIGYGGGAEANYVGEAKFTMTADLLTVQFEDDDTFTPYDRYD